MPIYEYTCEKCGHQLEAIQKFSDPLLIDCPECKEPALKKQISASAFQLKGTGWYATDFRDKGKKVDSTKDNDKDTEKKSSDTKPADSVASPDKNEKSDKDKKESKPDTASATTSQSTKSSSSGEQ